MPGAIAVLRRRIPPAWFGWLTLAIAAGALVAWFLHWLPLRPQYNQAWIALMMPIHLALAYVFMPRRLSA